MDKEVISLLVQSSGAAIVCGMFLWFLQKMARWLQLYVADTQERFEKLQKDFSVIIVKHIRENTEAMSNFAEKIHEFNETLKENKHVMESIYEHNVSLRKNKDIKNLLKDKRLKNIQTTAEGKSMLRALYEEKYDKTRTSK